MTETTHPGHDLADLSDTITPHEAAAAAERLRAIADSPAPDRTSLRRGRLLAWADALEATADLHNASTPQQAAAATERLYVIAEQEQATRGALPRAVHWPDALTAAASILPELNGRG